MSHALVALSSAALTCFMLCEDDRRIGAFLMAVGAALAAIGCAVDGF